MDGSTVIGTTNAKAIFSFPLTNSIANNTTYIITGLSGNWTTGDNCLDWSSNASEDVVNLGVDEQTNSVAIFDPSDQGACNFVTRPIYCAEQRP